MRTLYFTSPHPLPAFAESCLRLTPKVSLFDRHLYLEIDGTAKLAGGEMELLAQAHEQAEIFLEDFLFTLTDRPEWAQALAWAGQALLAPGESLPLLKRLNTKTLLLLGDPQTLEAERPEREKLIGFLHKVGIHSLGQFLELPAASVSRRFGKLGQTLHDWAAGSRPLCLPAFIPRDPIRGRIEADDLCTLEGLLFRLRQVLVQVENRLQGRQMAAKSIALLFNFEAHSPVVKTLQLTEGTQDAQALLRVLKDFLQAFHWESPLTRLELEVRDLISYQPGQLSLLDDSESKYHDLAQYVARLRARFGEDAAGFAQWQSSHLAERSFSLVWPPPPASHFPSAPLPPRPVFLFSPPKPFQPSPQWRLSFSENLHVEWWEPGGKREYFIAQRGGESLWVYRDCQKEAWFTHGSF
ncbi:hypothetical protein K2X33_15970 [bacterium]|nr:hypothetical protein [bacterium]